MRHTCTKNYLPFIWKVNWTSWPVFYLHAGYNLWLHYLLGCSDSSSFSHWELFEVGSCAFLRCLRPSVFWTRPYFLVPQDTFGWYCIFPNPRPKTSHLSRDSQFLLWEDAGSACCCQGSCSSESLCVRRHNISINSRVSIFSIFIKELVSVLLKESWVLPDALCSSLSLKFNFICIKVMLDHSLKDQIDESGRMAVA